MSTNPNYIARSHPIRVILDKAAHGHQPTKADLDRYLTEVSDERLPDGQSLDRYRAEIVRQSAHIAAVNATGNHGSAREAAETAAAELARTMTPEQRALNTSNTRSSDREVDDIIRRVFEN